MRKANQHLLESKKTKGKDALLVSSALCKSLGIRKDTLSRWRKLGLKPDGRGPGPKGQVADKWDLKRVREWMVKNVNVKTVSEAIPGAEGKPAEGAGAPITKTRGEGLMAMLERVRQSEKIDFSRYVVAIKSNDDLSIKSRRAGWLQSVEQLRKLEHDVPEIQKACGALVEKHIADQEMIRMCLTVKQQMLSLRGSLPVLLVGKDEAAMSILIDKYVRDACGSMVTGNKEIDALVEMHLGQMLGAIKSNTKGERHE